MNNKAFNVGFNDKDNDFYPHDCNIDTSLDNDIIEFFKLQKTEEEIHIKLNKKENIINENDNNKDAEKKQNIKEGDNYIENDSEEDIENGEDESSSSELIYSTFPDNIQIAKEDIYKRMYINEDIIKSVIEEYLKTKNKFLNELKKNFKSKDISQNDIFIINHKDFINCHYPEDNVIKNNILPFKSNEYLIKNINRCFKVLKNCNRKNNELGKLSEWIYTFLLFLEMPLSPEQNSDLYSINKYIYNNFMKTSELKIIFIIICEIFKQILII